MRIVKSQEIFFGPNKKAPDRSGAAHLRFFRTASWARYFRIDSLLYFFPAFAFRSFSRFAKNSAYSGQVE